ncbi:hypothetical protein CCR87_00425, partial [Rhodobaculum claviforme]|nr:hypothetical protein [Rhodobaculum claviforme]
MDRATAAPERAHRPSARRAGRIATALLCAAGLAAFAPQPAAAQTLAPGLKGEVWLQLPFLLGNETADLYADLPAFRDIDTLGASMQTNSALRTAANVLPRAGAFFDSRPPDGTFTSTALKYPWATDDISSGPETTMLDFLRRSAEDAGDYASFTLRDGLTEDALEPIIRQSVWRFTGALVLSPDTVYQFRIRSDDGNASWLGFDPAVGPSYALDPDRTDPQRARNFNPSGTFDAGDGRCCVYTFDTAEHQHAFDADGNAVVAFQLLFYERFGKAGLRMLFSTETDDTGAFMNYQIVGDDMLVRSDPGVGVIPLPASAVLLVSGLLGLGV